MELVEDQEVWLKPFEGQPRQHGVVLGVDGEIITVDLDPECRDSTGDDGLREVTEDQIESAGEIRERPQGSPIWDGETIGDLVRRALRSSGQAFDGWTAEQAARHLITHDPELEDSNLQTITIVVEKIFAE